MELKRILLIVPGERQKGACGVVDYAFQMAVAAARDEMEVLILPLYPVGIAEKDFLENLPEDLRPLVHLNPLQGATLIQRIIEIRQVVEDFCPDCVNIQFYPKLFKVGRRYLPALKALAEALQGWPVTITMHETWSKLGEAGSRSWVRKWIRIHDLKKGLRHLNPRLMLVSNECHFQQVTRAGFTAGKLPIISNIQRHELPEGMDLPSLMRRLEAGSDFPQQPLSILFFARIIPTWDPVPFIKALRIQAEKTGRNAVIISVGETGYGDQGWQQVVKTADNLPCIKLGKRSVEEVSWLLQMSDWGVSPTPGDFWMKSSSCAAMVTHELPIVFSSEASNAVLPPASWVTDHCGFKRNNILSCKNTHVTCVNEVWKRFVTGAASACFSSSIHPAARKGGADHKGLR